MTDIVIGLGEVGTAILKLLKTKYKAYGYDSNMPSRNYKNLIRRKFEYMHICYPYSDNFVDTFEEYLITFDPDIVVVHSTVPIGTCSMLSVGFERLVYSPIRGIHPDLFDHIKQFPKYLAHPRDRNLLNKVRHHFGNAGIKNTKTIHEYEQLEFMKLISTTYYGVLISWAQQIQMQCWENKWNYHDVTDFYKEHRYVYDGEKGLKPVLYGTEEIGKHCVLQNLPLLEESFRSPHIKAIKISNEQLKQFLKLHKKD